MAHTELPQVVAQQLPEHVREDYPTFVAFVEAYYEYLVSQGVDISHMRDIDTTLDEFVSQFKKELAYNLPDDAVHEDERFVLTRIKDMYLAKGSESSFKLLFRLLFGKEVSLYYPGQQMLIPSDGKWNQEISVFIKVDFGDVQDIIGKLVEISSGDRILSVLIDRKEELIGEVERVKNLGDGIYELYLDKRFFGVVNPGDIIKYKDIFQCEIIKATTGFEILQAGRDFRVGQVFELQSGTGTSSLIKVTAVNPNGGILRAEFIKFGIGYDANFSLQILSDNAVNVKKTSTSTISSRSKLQTYISDGVGTITSSVTNPNEYTVTTSGGSFGQNSGEVQVGDEIWTNPSAPDTPVFIGVVASIESSTSLTLVDPAPSAETDSWTFRNGRGVGDVYEYDIGIDTYEGVWTNSTIQDPTLGFSEQGYINAGDYFGFENYTNSPSTTYDAGQTKFDTWVDGTYAGTIKREFSLKLGASQVNAEDPAIISIDLNAICRYPGYFESNHGFLSDSIFIQDSKYYQKYSYVVKIDERLQNYSSAVRTMVHPSGMRLFGEFDITNNFNLQLALESLVKSLGISLEDEYIVSEDGIFWTLTKGFADVAVVSHDAAAITVTFRKTLADSFTPTEEFTHWTTKSLSTPTVGTLDDTAWVHETVKELKDTVPTMNHDWYFDIEKELKDYPLVTEDPDLDVAKYIETTTVGTWTNTGDIWKNPYHAQDYFSEEYSQGYELSFTN
jgi:hypothetical protein